MKQPQTEIRFRLLSLSISNWRSMNSDSGARAPWLRGSGAPWLRQQQLVICAKVAPERCDIDISR